MSDVCGPPLTVLTVFSGRTADVAAFGGGTAIALPLIPSPNTPDSPAADDDAADDGRDWLRHTLASNVGRR